MHMKMNDPFVLLKKMTDGHFHSGETLAQEAGLSRTSIWKTIQKIEQDYGLTIQAVTGKGYRLQQAIDLLHEEKIQQKLSLELENVFKEINVFPSLDSTNRYLSRIKGKGIRTNQVVLAEHQSLGQGRRGRQWVSPFGKNIYMSVLWHFDCGPSGLAGLSLVIAVVIARALNKQTTLQAELKWPNDIFYKGRKLGGNLLEVQGESSGPCSVIIGIGLNVAMSDEYDLDIEQSDIDQPWIDLKSAGSKVLDRNVLCATLLDELVPALNEFSHTGLDSFMLDWQRWDMLNSKLINLIFSDYIIEGKACGIDQQGALLVEYDNEIKAFHMGEVSVRDVGEKQQSDSIL